MAEIEKPRSCKRISCRVGDVHGLTATSRIVRASTHKKSTMKLIITASPRVTFDSETDKKWRFAAS
jgi:3-methyladenine DNA glycosylase Mpg